MPAIEQYLGTGRRKTSVARIILRRGTGKIIFKRGCKTINMSVAMQPFRSTGVDEHRFDVLINAQGGGSTGQTGAIRLGIARALLAYDEALRPSLRKDEHLTRDSRAVERKKYGKHKARRGVQYSKR
jgi:small subunit ribosomal protein S9